MEVQLFERLPRRMRLTAAGELLIVHVRATLREHARMQTQLSELQGHRRGLVRLATMGGLATSLLPEVVNFMGARHPSVKLVVQVLSRDAIVAAVLAGDADLALGYQLPPDPKLRLLARAELRVGAVTGPGHPLANRATVSLGECAGYPLVIPDRTVTIGALMADAFERGVIAVDTASETNSIELLKTVAAAGQAVTFLNELDVRRERQAGTLVFMRLPEAQLPRQELRLVQRTGGRLDAAQSVLAEHLREMVQELEDSAG